MYTENFTDLSVVRLADGREGTVVHVYADGAACVEIDGTGELVDVTAKDIREILWKP